MSSNNRPPHDDPDPREILSRAVERLPVEERGRAREALEAMAGPDEQAREIAALYDAVDELQERLARALDWLNAANQRTHLFDHVTATLAGERQYRRDLQTQLQSLRQAADAVVEAAQALLAVDDPVDIIRRSQGLRMAIDQYQDVQEPDDE